MTDPRDFRSDETAHGREERLMRQERRLHDEDAGYADGRRAVYRDRDRRDRDGNVGMLAFLVGALLVAVIAVALWFVYEGNQAADDDTDVDVSVELPAPPPMPEAPRLPDAPDLPPAPDLPTPDVGQAVGDAAESLREALPDDPLPPGTGDPTPEPVQF